MAHVFDFHFHSLYSDGNVMPAEYVKAAVESNPDVSHLALSDHDTYNGCAKFLDACREYGIEGFVCAEISGTHPGFPQFEMHLLAVFGNEWNEDVAARTDLFHPYWNKLRKNDISNLFLFLEKAAELGYPMSFRDVTRKSLEKIPERNELRNPGLIQPVNFAHLRKLMHERGIEEQDRQSKESFEKRVWRETGTAPAYTPPFSEAFDAFQKARPALCLAHPMVYPWSLDDARRVIPELKEKIGLVALEAHYAGELHPEWKALAEETGLLVSAGSDCHAATGVQTGSHERHSLKIPVVDEGDCDFEALLNAYRNAGR